MSTWIQRLLVLGVLLHASMGHAQYQRGSSIGNFIGMSASGFARAPSTGPIEPVRTITGLTQPVGGAA